MKVGNLTPRTNSLIKGFRFTGSFGQKNGGFGSVLEASVKCDGRLVLTLTYESIEGERTWSVELDNEQRRKLAELASCYEPKLFERIVVE